MLLGFIAALVITATNLGAARKRNQLATKRCPACGHIGVGESYDTLDSRQATRSWSAGDKGGNYQVTEIKKAYYYYCQKCSHKFDYSKPRWD